MNRSVLWKRLQIIAIALLVLTIVVITYTFTQWVKNDSASYESLDFLAFALVSTLSAVLIFGWLSRSDVTDDSHLPLFDLSSQVPNTGPLHNQISQTFNLNELQILCPDLNIDYEELAGNTKSQKIQSLIEMVQRHNRMPDFITILQQKRPHIRWQVPTTLTSYSWRVRQLVLQNIQATWVEGYLHQSLQHAIAIELNLTYEPEAVNRKTIRVLGQAERLIDKSVRDLFEESGHALLILGAPGSGKTITLLQLAEQLVKEAKKKPNEMMPVVLNLSSWAEQQLPLAEWLAEEMFVQYGVSKKQTLSWIHGNQLLYLLDGLDEVADVARDNCVKAINEFRETQMVEIVVCSRIADYTQLSSQLNLTTAVCIQPLSDMQIQAYLGRSELSLQAVRATIKFDSDLAQLIRSPLMLSIMTLAYHGISNEELQTLTSIEARRKHIFATYVNSMFERRPLAEDTSYKKKQALNWLTNIALGLQKHKQTVFYIERLQATWLPSKRLRSRFDRLNNLIFGLIGGLGGGFIGWLVGSLIGKLVIGPMFGLIDGVRLASIAGLIGGGILGIIFGLSIWIEKEITLREDLYWKPPPLDQILRRARTGFIRGLTAGLIGGLTGGLITKFSRGLIFGLFAGLILGIMFGLLFGLVRAMEACIQRRPIQWRTHPNQGIRNSFYNALRMSGLYGFLFGGSGGIIGGFIGLCIVKLNVEINIGLIGGLKGGLLAGVIGGLTFGLIGGLIKFGGNVVIQHYTLRQSLTKIHLLPFSFRDKLLIAYLDDMTDHVLLRRVGGGWVFIHRSFLEYFADLYPE